MYITLIKLFAPSFSVAVVFICTLTCSGLKSFWSKKTQGFPNLFLYSVTEILRFWVGKEGFLKDHMNPQHWKHGSINKCMYNITMLSHISSQLSCQLKYLNSFKAKIVKLIFKYKINIPLQKAYPPKTVDLTNLNIHLIITLKKTEWTKRAGLK